MRFNIGEPNNVVSEIFNTVSICGNGEINIKRLTQMEIFLGRILRGKLELLIQYRVVMTYDSTSLLETKIKNERKIPSFPLPVPTYPR